MKQAVRAPFLQAAVNQLLLRLRFTGGFIHDLRKKLFHFGDISGIRTTENASTPAFSDQAESSVDARKLADLTVKTGA